MTEYLITFNDARLAARGAPAPRSGAVPAQQRRGEMSPLLPEQ
ncbi:hypothetical protein ACIA5D_28890 [Actinoplanes sp. NPDC051513]